MSTPCILPWGWARHSAAHFEDGRSRDTLRGEGECRKAGDSGITPQRLQEEEEESRSARSRIKGRSMLRTIPYWVLALSRCAPPKVVAIPRHLAETYYQPI